MKKSIRLTILLCLVLLTFSLVFTACNNEPEPTEPEQTETEKPTEKPTEAPKHVHTWGEWTVVKEATCTEEGAQTRACSECKETQTAPIQMTEHVGATVEAVAPTCTEKGLTEGKKCATCGTVLVEQEEVEATGHVEAVIEAVAPTCTKAGSTAGKKCALCETVIEAPKLLSALGHTEEVIKGKAATCTEDGLTDGKHCTVCDVDTVEQKVIKATGHKKVKDAAVAATCTRKGLTDGEHCSVCNTVFKKQEIVPMKPHTPETDAAVAPTCTAEGKTEGSHCSVCNTVLVAQNPVNKLDHDIVTDARIEPTCTSEGREAGQHCTTCTTQTVVGDTIPMLPHTYEYNVCTAAGCGHKQPMVLGDANVIIFSEDEINANEAFRKLLITEAGYYKFSSEDLFVSAVLDSEENEVVARDYVLRYLVAGEYSLKFMSFDMFSIEADTSYGLTVEKSLPTYYSGNNELYFVQSEVDNGKADRYLDIWVDGNYTLPFTVTSVLDPEGNPVEKDAENGYYTLVEGKYTITLEDKYGLFGWAVSDEPSEFVVTLVDDEQGGGEEEGDPVKDALGGTYEFTELGLSFYFYNASYSIGDYAINVYGAGYDPDLYYTYTVSENEGVYTIVPTFFANNEDFTGNTEESDTLGVEDMTITATIDGDGVVTLTVDGEDNYVEGGEGGGEEEEPSYIDGTTYYGTNTWFADDHSLTVVVGDTQIGFYYSNPMQGDNSIIADYTLDGDVVTLTAEGQPLNPMAAGITFVDGVPTEATYNGTAYTLSITAPEEGGGEGGGEEEEPADIGNYIDTMDVETTDTYGYFDLYTFTATNAGQYTFVVPAGLGFYSKPQYDVYGPAELDFGGEGGNVTVTLEAGEEYEFYVGATTKAEWTIDVHYLDAVKSSLGGTYEFDAFDVMFLWSSVINDYVVNVWDSTNDLYYTYDVVDNDGVLTITADLIETYSDWYTDATDVFNFETATVTATIEDDVVTLTVNGEDNYVEGGEGGGEEEEPSYIDGTTYYGTDNWGNQTLTVVVGDTQIGFYFVPVNPMMGMPSEMIYDYTLEGDSCTLTQGVEVVAASAANITFTDGVPTAAVYNGNDYTLAAEGAENDNGSGTDADPYIIDGAGDYTCAFPGGWTPIFYAFTVEEDGYVTVSSTFASAWLMVGNNPMAMTDNEGNGSVTAYVSAGNTCYIGVGDWDEAVVDVPFTVSFEAGSAEPDGTAALPYALSENNTCEFPGGWNPVFYTYTAEEAGTLTITMTSADYYWGYGAGQYEQNNVGNATPSAPIALEAGQTILISISTNSANAGTITFTAEFTPAA